MTRSCKLCFSQVVPGSLFCIAHNAPHCRPEPVAKPLKTFPFYGIAQMLSPTSSRPFYVIETYWSIDGPRTRIARGGFQTQAEAETWLESKGKKSGG